MLESFTKILAYNKSNIVRVNIVYKNICMYMLIYRIMYVYLSSHNYFSLHKIGKINETDKTVSTCFWEQKCLIMKKNFKNCINSFTRYMSMPLLKNDFIFSQFVSPATPVWPISQMVNDSNRSEHLPGESEWLAGEIHLKGVMATVIITGL